MVLAQESAMVDPFPEPGSDIDVTYIQPTIVMYPTARNSVDSRIFPSEYNQSEMSIAISPVDPDKILVGANTFIQTNTGNNFYQGYYYSQDGGTNWSGDDVLPGINNLSADPVVAYDIEGNAYFHYISRNPLSRKKPFLKKSTDGGVTWQNSVNILGFDNADKGHMAIDGTNIYIALTDFGLTPRPVLFVRSTDGGESFSDTENISGIVTSQLSMGVNLASGYNNQVYAVWAIDDDWDYDDESTHPTDGIGFNKSLDGGANWQIPSRIFDIDGSRGYWYDKNPGGANYPIRMNDFPCIVVDKSGRDWNGTIYMVWGAKGNALDRANIYFSRSIDEGSTWSTPLKIHNDNTNNDQWFPWISVDELGIIHIVFYDSRNDPNNQLTEVWVAQSINGGESFRDFPVSDIAFTPLPIPGTGTGYMGDYIGITSKPGKAYASWMDNRTGIYQVYVDIIDNTVSGIITENTTWSGYKLVTGNVSVTDGVVLTIEPGTAIFFESSTFLIANGDLIINGTESNPVVFTSNSANPLVGDWYGIIIESGNLEMNYCDISYADVGVQFNGAGTGVIQNSHIINCNTGIEYVPPPVFTPTSSFTVQSSSVSGCDVGIHAFGGTIDITNNNQIENNITGILIEQGRSFKIFGNDIVLNSKAGLVVRNSSGGIIEGNVISGNGNEAEWQTDRITGGIFLHASSPTITNNIIQNNKLHGITEMNGSRPILNYRERALNQINNNGDPYDPAVFDAEIRWFDQSIPHLDYGHNDIMDEDGGYLIYGNYSPFNPVVRVRHNYWAEFEPTLENRFYPIEGYLFRPYDTEPNGTPPNGFFADAPALFDQGLQCAEDEDWDNAISTYHSIITSYPESKEASGSVIRLYAITKITDGDFQELQDYYNLLLNAFPETILSKTAEQYAILCDVALQAFAVAIGKYETILQNPPSLEDSVYAVIDIGQVYLASSVAGGNGLGRKAAIGTMPEYEPDDFADYEEKVNHALSAMMGKTVASQSEVLPMDFALYSNYPNPFNPITNIKIDIPENSHIKVTVIDLSGRVVTELMNHNITAGKHQTIWNGKDNKGRQVSSGVYLYILTAKSNETGKIFTKSNKMVLLK